MDPLLVIGYGNPLRGDDGVGWVVAEAVAAALPPTAATVVTVHQLTPELAEPISRAARVVFVDAAAEGEPGGVDCFALDVVTEQAGSGPQYGGTHLTTPDMLLAMAGALFGRRPPAHMVTIAGEIFDLTEALSPVVEGAALQAVEWILATAQGSVTATNSTASPASTGSRTKSGHE